VIYFHHDVDRPLYLLMVSGGLPAGNSAPAKGSHGSRRGLIADFS
jgi:hypothetical protein